MALAENRVDAAEERRAVRRLIDLSQEESLDEDVWATNACGWPDKERQSNGKEERRRKYPQPSTRLHPRSVSARKSRLSVPESQSKVQSHSYLSMLDGRVLIASARVTQPIPIPAFLAAPELKSLPLRRVRKHLQSSYVPYSLVKQSEERAKVTQTPAHLLRSVVLPGLHEGVYHFPWGQRKPEDKENKAHESGLGLQIKSRFAKRPHSIAM